MDYIYLILFIIGIYVAFYFLPQDRLAKYSKILNLQKANLVYSEDYNKISEIILPARDSVFSKYEPIIWQYKNGDQILFLGANNKADLRIWLQPDINLPDDTHIVLDGSRNKSKLIKAKFPKQKVILEGDFPEYFDLYCQENQQIIALQIISPDIMAYIVDNLVSVDIEILGDHVAIISKKGAKNEQTLRANIELAKQIDKLARAACKVRG